MERIDLLKVDVEGAEMDVLAGIDDCHWPLVQQLCMEVEVANKPHVGALLGRLNSLGFTRVSIKNMFGGECRLDDPVSFIIYAVRKGIR